MPSKNSSSFEKNFTRHIHDNVHGYIGLTKVENDVIDTEIFQRLRRIRHLGLASYVYPSATHSRFAHSIGAMFVMDQMAKRLINQGFINKDDRQTLRLVALLHDVGQYPYSHSVERVMINRYTEKAKHEKLGVHIIKNTVIKDILSNYDLEKIIAILEERYSKPRLYNYLISSDLDVDKIDYLLRDSYHTGVAYGHIDVNRLIRTITVDENIDRLAVEEKGKQAIENLSIGRYHMFQTIYYHKTVVAFELLLGRVYEKLLDESEMYDWNSLVKLDEDTIAQWDDHYVWNKMIKRKNDKNGDYLEELIRMMTKRIPLEMACYDPAFSVEHRSRLELLRMSVQLDLLSKESDVKKDWIFYSEPSEIMLAVPEKAIMVRKDGGCINIVDDATSIINRLVPFRYISPRVYSKNEEHCEKLRSAIRKCLGIQLSSL